MNGAHGQTGGDGDHGGDGSRHDLSHGPAVRSGLPSQVSEPYIIDISCPRAGLGVLLLGEVSTSVAGQETPNPSVEHIF